MRDFIGTRIEVEHGPSSPTPVRFTWQGETHEVADVLASRVDTGYGRKPPRSRKWYTRRHRRYFVVKDTAGDIFEMYLDYADRDHPTWWLVKMRERLDDGT